MTTYDETPYPYPAPYPQNRPGIHRIPRGAADHHMAGYLPGTTRLFQDPATGYATNYGIGSYDAENYVIHEYVPDDQVAWGNGNSFLNTYGVSIEHENNRAEGYASKPTREVHELSARFHAALALKWGWTINGKVQLVVRDFPNHDYYGAASIPGFGTEFNIIGHRAVALKDCPRDLDMSWIADRGNEIIRNAGPTSLDVGTITRRKEQPMGLLSNTSGHIEWQGPAGKARVGTPLVRDLLIRYEQSLTTAPGKPEDIPVFNDLELQYINQVIVAANTADDDARSRIQDKLDDLAATLDGMTTGQTGQ